MKDDGLSGAMAVVFGVIIGLAMWAGMVVLGLVIVLVL